MYMMKLLSVLQNSPLIVANCSRMVQTAFIPSGVARKVTVLSSAKDSTLSVSRFDSKKKGSVGSWPLTGTGKKGWGCPGSGAGTGTGAWTGKSTGRSSGTRWWL